MVELIVMLCMCMLCVVVCSCGSVVVDCVGFALWWLWWL